MSEVLQALHAERKARLIRLGAVPRRRLSKAVHKVVSEQAGLISELKDAAETPNVMASWVKRQKAITKELRASVQESEHSRPRVEKIQTVTANYFSLDRDELLSARRSKETVYARMIAVWLCKTLTLRSYPDIAARFGGRDHTTAIHSFQKISRLIRSDWEVAYDVAHLEALLS